LLFLGVRIGSVWRFPLRAFAAPGDMLVRSGGPMTARIFLGLSALLWLPCGIYCFFQLGALADAASGGRHA